MEKNNKRIQLYFNKFDNAKSAGGINNIIKAIKSEGIKMRGVIDPDHKVAVLIMEKGKSTGAKLYLKGSYLYSVITWPGAFKSLGIWIT